MRSASFNVQRSTFDALFNVQRSTFNVRRSSLTTTQRRPHALEGGHRDHPPAPRGRRARRRPRPRPRHHRQRPFRQLRGRWLLVRSLIRYRYGPSGSPPGGSFSLSATHRCLTARFYRETRVAQGFPRKSPICRVLWDVLSGLRQNQSRIVPTWHFLSGPRGRGEPRRSRRRTR
jgi:hypothetical protein